jgi:hypothetical protein
MPAIIVLVDAIFFQVKVVNLLDETLDVCFGHGGYYSSFFLGGKYLGDDPSGLFIEQEDDEDGQDDNDEQDNRDFIHDNIIVLTIFSTL